jgi:hypothetical protein
MQPDPLGGAERPTFPHPARMIRTVSGGDPSVRFSVPHGLSGIEPFLASRLHSLHTECLVPEPYTMPRAVLHIAREELQARMGRDEVRLPGVPGGREGEVMVLSDRNAFFVSPDETWVRCVPRSTLRAFAVLHALAATGALVMLGSWIVGLLALLMGSLLASAVLVSGAGAALFMASALTVSVMGFEPRAVEPGDPLADEAADALLRAARTGPTPGAVLPWARALRRGLGSFRLELPSP